MLKRVLLTISTIMTASCGVDEMRSDQAHSALQGYPAMDDRWPSSTIAVCWEASTDPWHFERMWVETKIALEYHAKTNLRFVGWQKCPDPIWPLPYKFDGISIAIRNSGPRAHTVGLGTELRNERKGMNLHFRFEDVEGLKSCVGEEKQCIEALAVHEFGHAIGMAHEQNRPDTPGFCNQRQGDDGSQTVGLWDLDSVMNYCNPIWNANGTLSAKDIDTIHVMYPDPTWRSRAEVQISQVYSRLQREAGPLGSIAHGITPTPDGYGYLQGFANGWIYATPGRGAFEVFGEIAKRWSQLGWERFGYPVTGEQSTPDGIGRYNHFEDGRSIYWSPATGAHEIYGEIRFLWASLGWEQSFLGFPTSGEMTTPDGVGRMHHFQSGSIYWRANEGAFAVPNHIMHEWGKTGWERGPLGYPIDRPMFLGTISISQRFQNGMVYWNRNRGSWTVMN
jgi:hypothetical protein